MGTLIGALSELLDLALPRRCAGCERPGTGWCPACAAELAGHARSSSVHLAAPHPCPLGLAPVRVCCAYDGAARAALVAYKDGERRDLAAALAPLLAVPLVVALDALPGRYAAVAGGPVVVPVPSSRTSHRRRGDLPLHALAGRATRLLPAGQRPPVVEALRVRRRVADQAGLGAQARWANLHGAFELRPSALPMLRAAAAVVLVDDVLTTGATLAEAQRVLTGSTAVPLALVAIAATSRRGRGPGEVTCHIR